MAKETPDPETTLACWAWLLRALHHAREARDDAREALEALDLTAIQIAGLRERIAAIDESERACLEAAAKGDPWRVWDRYTNSPRAEAAFGGFARDLCRRPSVAHLAPGRGADNSHRHRVIGEIHRIVASALEADRALSDDETMEIALLVAALEDTLVSLDGEALARSLAMVRRTFKLPAEKSASRKLVIVSDLVGLHVTRIREILEILGITG